MKQTNEKNINKSLIKFAFVGSSCSGKSSVLTLLKKWWNPTDESKWSVYFIEEAATEILEKNKGIKNSSLEFQKAVLELQLSKENIPIPDDETGKTNLLLCDRAIADAFVFQPNDAENLLHMSIKEALNCYDYCIYFLPYFTENLRTGNELRCETSLDEVVALEHKTRSVYGKHEHLFFAPCFNTVKERGEYVAKLLNLLLCENVFNPLD